MSLYKKQVYIDDLDTAISAVVCFEKLKNKMIMIAGAAGLIGSFLVDLLMRANEIFDANITILALGRSRERLSKRFEEIKTDKLIYIQQDVTEGIDLNYLADFIIHAASNAYPASFNTDPVGTIMSNILGTKRLLDYGLSHKTQRLLFVSSGEVYGQGDLAIDSFEESYSGYLDPVQPRSCYPASKRTAETLCTSYTKQFGLDTVIVRPCHTYGPNVTSSDNRANVQFVNNVLRGEDIVMNSTGTQMRSYCYISDCASAILTVLLNGKSCEAYNIVNSGCRVTIADFARTVAKVAGRNLIFENPDTIALAEQTPISKQVLNTEKLESLGWEGKYSVQIGIEHTLSALID